VVDFAQICIVGALCVGGGRQGIKSTCHEIQAGGPLTNFKSSNRRNSVADCSILFQFSKEFDHMTVDVRQTVKVKESKSNFEV